MEQSANWRHVRNNFTCLLFSFKNVFIFCFFPCMICAFAVCINLRHLKYFYCNVMVAVATEDVAAAVVVV